MLAKERQKIILEMLSRKHIVKTNDVASEFGITNLTARKDLDALREQGYVERVYGGAVLLSSFHSDAFIENREDRNSNQQKDHDQKIALLAASMVKEGDNVLLGNNQIIYEIAKNLVNVPNLTFITASMQTAVLLMNNGCDIYLLGGKIDPLEHNIYSRSAVDMLEKLVPTKTFITCDGVSAEHGVTTAYQPGAELGYLAIKNAEQAILVVPSRKFGRSAMNKVCDFSDLHAIVTDDDLSGDYREKMKKTGVQMYYARLNDE